MTPGHDTADLIRWQQEVARDPGSPAFVLLAEAYRREGRTDVARRLCLRGLERAPESVRGHHVLGRVYRDIGEEAMAQGAWEAALALDPSHHASHRALGYLCLERRQWADALRHLEPVAAAEGGDARLQGALDLARRRLAAEGRSGGRRDVSDALERVATAVAVPLDRFAREGRFRFVLLLDRSGRVLTQRALPRELDVAALASLGAGIHAASSGLAGVLGQPAFGQLCQGDGDRQVFLGSIPSPLGELLALGALGGDSNVGLARLAFGRLLQDLEDAEWPAPTGPAEAAALEDELAASVRRAVPGS